MQIGQGQVPLRLNFDPLNTPARRSTAASRLSRALAAASDPAAFRQRASQLTDGARQAIQQKDRTGAYAEIASKLANVRESLTLPEGAKPDVSTIKQAAASLNEALGTLEALTDKGASRQDDALARDIREGLAGLFSESRDGSLRGLGDLGFSREDGALSLDAERLAEIEAERPEALEAFLANFVDERATPLVNAASQALVDAESRGPLEQSLAQKAVAVQADISRLETRKQDLLFQQVRFEDQQASLKAQGETLQKTRRQLEQEEAKELPPDLLDIESRRAELQPDVLGPQPAQAPTPTPAPTPQAPAPIGVPAQPTAPGLSSFGLA